MNCPNCGSNADGVFCAVCGAKLPGNTDIELDPNARRRAAEKAAEEAEAMKRRYEEAAKAANEMLAAIQAEESAAARARAEREESLRRAVSEAEALLSDKTSKLAAAQSEQKAAERLLAECRAAIAEYQNTGVIPETINNNTVHGGFNPEFHPSPMPANTIRQPEQAHMPPNQPEHPGYMHDPVWPAPDPVRQPQDITHNSTGIIPGNTLIQPGTPQPWMEKTAPGIEPVVPTDMTWPPGGTHQNAPSPWAAPPDPEPRWSPDMDPSQKQLWDTIQNNTSGPEAEEVLRQAAEYWRDSLPMPNDRMVNTNVQHDPRMQQADPRPTQQDPWGNTAPSATWQGNEQPHAGVPDNNGSIDMVRRPGNQREFANGERASNDNQEYDDDDEAEYDDDDYDDEDENKSEKKPFLRGIFGGKKKNDDEDYEDDDDEFEYDDEDYEDEDDEDYEDDDHDEKSGSSVVRIILYVLAGLVVIALLVILVLQFLPETAARDDQDPLPNALESNYTDAPPDYLTVVDYPAVYEPEEPPHIEPSLFAEVPISRISMVREGRVLFCSTHPPGVFIMNDDYSEPRTLTDMQAFNGVFEPPWIYFISVTGIFRIRDDGYGEPQQIISETYHIGHRFYVFNDYLYYLRAYNENWSLNRLNLTEWDTDGEAAEERIISNVDLSFYMDSFGVYALADQGVHAGLPSLNEELVAPTQTELEALNRKDVIFYSFASGDIYRIGTLYVERFVATRDDGVLVQTRSDGFIKEFLISWLPENSDYSHRKSFGGPHGIYELTFNQRGSYALHRRANGTVVLIADNIEFNVFELTESAFYFLTATPTDQSITYKMMKYNLHTEDDTADVIIDFSVFDQLLVGVMDRVTRGDTSFDNFLTLPHLEGGYFLDDAQETGDTFEVILFAGLAISTEVPEGRLFVFDRTDGSHIELSPAV